MNRLMLTTALVCASTVAAYAQSSDAAQDQDCKKLVVLLTQKKIANSPVTLTQAKSYDKDQNYAPCHKVLVAHPQLAADNSDNDATGAQVNVHQPAAKVQVRQPNANVSVKQAQPQVTVNQGQPTVVVHQPAPTVTVNIPQPIITIRMPEPDVNVAQAKPQVSVSQPQPQVSVVQPQDGDQANVTTSGETQQADVNVNQSNQAPNIQYSSDKAKVVVKQSSGQPKVNLVHAGDADDVPDTGTNQTTQQRSDAGSQQQQAMATQGTNAGGKPVAVSKLLHMNLYNVNGNNLGDIEHVIANAQGGNSVVIGHGGFLGMGEKQIAVPLDDVWMKGGRLVTRNVTDDQIKGMPEYNKGQQTDLDGGKTVVISQSEG